MVEGASSSCGASPASLCNFNIEMMNRFDLMVTRVRKRLEKTTKHINKSIQEYKNKKDKLYNDFKKQTNEKFKSLIKS